MIAALNTVEPPILVRWTARLERDRPWHAARFPLTDQGIRDRLTHLSACPVEADWLGGAFSAGDLMMVSDLPRLKSTGLPDEHPNLFAYAARSEARPACQRAFPTRMEVNSGRPLAANRHGIPPGNF